MNYEPETALYKFDGWKGVDFYLQVKPKGQAGRFFIDHKEEGRILLTPNEAHQLMEALMHYFNKEVS